MNKLVCGEDWQITKTCVQERFKQLLSLSCWTDCTFRVGHRDVQVINGHRLVLAVSSPVFEALFYGSMAASSGQVISVPDIEPNTFRAFLQYLYSDKVNLESIEEAGELLYAAKKYLVQPLAMLCVNYLVQHTWIRTLWDVLPIAEALCEDRLVSACIKVMSRYGYEIWNDEEANMSSDTLSRLLSLEETSMSESELFEVVIDWARKELIARGVMDTPRARRAIIDAAGLISKIRFLTIPLEQLDYFQGLLSPQEVESLKLHRNIPSCFSLETKPRGNATALTWRNTREMVSSRNQVWVNLGEVICKLISSSTVLVMGFEVFTRLAQVTPFIKAPQECSYREKLVVFINDSQGNILQKTDYDSVVRFNSVQNITLSRPMWFEADRKYTIKISFIGGQYPMCEYNNGSSRGTSFTFEETVLLEGGNKVPSSFIISVLYAL